MSQATFDEFRRSYGDRGSSFGDFLQFRVSGIGIQSRLGAEVFWGVEIGLGSLAAAWVVFRHFGRARADGMTPRG